MNMFHSCSCLGLSSQPIHGREGRHPPQESLSGKERRNILTKKRIGYSASFSPIKNLLFAELKSLALLFLLCCLCVSFGKIVCTYLHSIVWYGTIPYIRERKARQDPLVSHGRYFDSRTRHRVSLACVND